MAVVIEGKFILLCTFPVVHIILTFHSPTFLVMANVQLKATVVLSGGTVE